MKVKLAADASGGYEAAMNGDVVLVVDVIDMTTTLEAVLQAGAFLVLGAAPAGIKPPVPINPCRIGIHAAKKARENSVEVVVVSEPRAGKDEERLETASPVIRALSDEGLDPPLIVPNMGAEIVKLTDFRNKIVIAVTACGGTVFDSAFNAGAPVITGTVARTYGSTGWENAEKAAAKAFDLAKNSGREITVVAASSKALEDVLASQYLLQIIKRRCFCNLV